MENDNQTEVQIRKTTLSLGLGYSNDVLLSFPEQVIKKGLKKPDKISGNDINSIPKSNENAYNEIIEPPLELSKLKDFYDISDSLRTCIETYAVNVVGFGYEFIPEWDMKEKNGKTVFSDSNKPVQAELVKEIKAEKAMLQMFYEAISLDDTWTEIQEKKLTLKEIYGNSYIEYERDIDGNLQGAVLIDADTIKLTKHETEGILIEHWIKNPETLEYQSQMRLRKFRRFVQLSSAGAIQTYFKEFGDPRVMNAYNGKYYKDSSGEFITDNTFFPENEKFKLATEIYHFKVLDPGNLYGYGLPRWVSLIPALLGVRSSDLLNCETFKNKGIPDFIVIVEGATADTITKQIEDHVKQNKKVGKFGNLLVVSADAKKIGTPGPNMDYKNPAIRIEPLNILTQKEGLALNYQTETRERVFSIYRLPKILTGKSSDLNRATAEVEKQIVEEQVFAPLRVKEDDIQNKKILADKKIKYWKYASKSSKLEDVERRVKYTLDGTTKGVILPREARKTIAKDLNITLEEIESEWMDNPVPFSIRSNVKSIPLDTKAEIPQKVQKYLESEGYKINSMCLVSVENEN